MPTLQPGAPEQTQYDIQLDKSDLTNSYQFDDAASTICARMIRPFGLQMFCMSIMRWMRYSIIIGKDLDGRRAETKRLEAATEALYKAAWEYDEAVRACRESVAKKSRGRLR